MLEDRKQLTELDDDFITLWSNYIIYQDMDLVLPFLEILAENGQINAIQSWYLLKNPEAKNDKIDMIVDSFDLSCGHNKIWAMANREYSKAKNYFIELENSIKELNKQAIETDETYYFRRRNELIGILASTGYSKLNKLALKKSLETLSNTKSSLVCETSMEIANSFPNLFNYQFGEKSILQTKKTLIEDHKKAPNDPATAFALAKHLHLFGKNEQDYQTASDICKNLSSRELHTFPSKLQEDSTEKLESTAKIKD